MAAALLVSQQHSLPRSTDSITISPTAVPCFAHAATLRSATTKPEAFRILQIPDALIAGYAGW